jgi:parallel beta-helix repeat protein
MQQIGLRRTDLFKETVPGMALTLLLTSALVLTFLVQPVGASDTTYIRADGHIDSPTLSISTVNNITYTFTGNINDSIVVERDNIVIDGAGYTLQGSGEGIGIDLSGRNNVTIKNTTIKKLHCGIYLDESSNNSVIAGNSITNNDNGVWFDSSSYNSISRNNITSNIFGMEFDSSSYNSASENNVTKDRVGIVFRSSSINSISGSNVTSNDVGVWFDSSLNNSIYHNDFVNNVRQVYSSLSVNVWDDGYPSGGNYWSDYSGIDLRNGVYQNEAGSDWIGDWFYTIDQKNTDRYPLMHPFALEVQEYEVAYRDLLHRYNEMYSELAALNSTCKSLQESIANLTMTFDMARDNLQGQINSLNSTCVSLSRSLADLQGQLNGLNSTMQTSINRLQEEHNSLGNQVNNLLNLMYVLVGLSVVLIIVTIYFVTRKPNI